MLALLKFIFLLVIVFFIVIVGVELFSTYVLWEKNDDDDNIH